MEESVCDRCSQSISKGEGHLFYSSNELMGDTVGNMLLCDQCTNGLINNEMYTKNYQIDGRDLMTVTDPKEMKAAIQQANDLGIIVQCKTLGLSPNEAKEKARELAVLFWENREKAEAESKTFWTSEGEAQTKEKSNCFIATAVYGHPSAEEVMVFRQFRDQYLTKHILGSWFIRSYYWLSPSIAKRIENSKLCKELIRKAILGPMLKILKSLGFDDWN